MGLVAAATLGTILYAAATHPPVEEQATVMRVVDGDTIDVLLNDKSVRVRLLKIETPETQHPNELVECMGPQATDLLSELLPHGSNVMLEYDEEREDPYGRLLAGEFHQGELVNAEIAAQGLGGAVAYEPNRKFYAPVKAAEETARVQQRGLFDPEIECTLASQVAELQDQVAAVEQPLPKNIADIEEALAGLAPVEDLVSGFSLLVTADDPELSLVHAIYQPLQEQFKRQIRDHKDSIDEYRDSLEDHQADLEREEERRKAEEERQRKAAEEERKRQEAEAEAEAERQRQAEAEQQQQRRQTPPAPPTTPPSSSNSGDASGSSQGTSHGSTGGTPSSQPKPKPPQQNQAPAGYGTESDYPGDTGLRCYVPGGLYWTPC